MKILRHSLNRLFRTENLLFTNVALSCSLGLVGDVIEQRIEMYRGELDAWDRKRTSTMFFTGAPIGVYCHYYYIMLDRYLPGRNLRTLSKKVFVDQFVCSPVCIGGFLALIAMVEGHSWDRFVEDLRNKGTKLYKADWLIWPPAQVINFYYLPPQYRVLYDNVISLGFDIYTSHVTYGRKKNRDDDDSKDIDVTDQS